MNMKDIGLLWHLEVVEVVPAGVVPPPEEPGVLVKGARESLSWDQPLVVKEGDAAVRRVARHEDHPAALQEARGEHVQGQVGLDHPRGGQLGGSAQGAEDLLLLLLLPSRGQGLHLQVRGPDPQVHLASLRVEAVQDLPHHLLPSQQRAS